LLKPPKQRKIKKIATFRESPRYQERSEDDPESGMGDWLQGPGNSIRRWLGVND
jgi:hypothetical protein